MNAFVAAVIGFVAGVVMTVLHLLAITEPLH